MTPERYEQITDLFRLVAELEPEKRAAFLDVACSSDEDLRQEIESLLNYQAAAEQFIETPALEIVAKDLAVAPSNLAAGEQLNHYRILSQLGAGGMGEVYLAQDTRLGRRVALKLLLPEVANSQPARKRLLQEAQSAAALNHPNIVTIYSIEETTAFDFIVMEYVEGETLAAKIKRRDLAFPQLLDAGRQITEALAAAHAIGLIHRDIKPANVLLTREGQVKLLDFGVAKMTSPFTGENVEEASTLLQLTLKGMVVGTVAYMSPEQVRGEGLDARTDIFSLGATLYKGATGTSPFAGSSAFAMMKKIVESEPSPPSTLNQDLPPQFDFILRRALAKDRAERYQSALEFNHDLSELQSKVISEFSGDAEQTLKLRSRQSTGKRKVLVSENARGQIAGLGSQRADAEVARLRSPVFIRRKALLIILLIIALVSIGFLGYRLLKQTGNRPAKFPDITETRLTNTGNLVNAAISPDGKYIAYAVMDSEQTSSLWIRQLAAASNAQLIPPAETSYSGMTFSRDGNYIYYTAKEKNAPAFSLYRIPLLGGTAKKIKEDVDGFISFSPDGKRFVFRLDLPAQRQSTLLVANADGSGEQKIAAMKSPEFFGDPAWSPDGKVIACSAGHADGGSNRYVIEVNVDDWTMRPIATKRWRWVGQVAWLADGKGLLMIASENSAEPYRVWHLSYPDGAAQSVTNNSLSYNRLSLANASAELLAIQIKRNTNLWLVPGEEPRFARKMSFGAGGFRSQIRWSQDGKIVFESEMGGTSDISVMDEDGSNRKQLLAELTGQAIAVSPSVSSDGQYIVFGFDLTGTRHIWRMDTNGGNLTQLTDGNGEDHPHCSADGKWVVYTDIGSDKPTLWKVSIDGGEATQLTKTFSRFPTVSPDGKLISCLYVDGASKAQKIAVIPFDGGEPIKVFPQSVHNGYPIKWTPDGRALTYTDTNQSNLWLQPLAGGKSRKLTDFSNDLIFGFEWSPDGKRLACVRGIWERDLMLIKNFK